MNLKVRILYFLVAFLVSNSTSTLAQNTSAPVQLNRLSREPYTGGSFSKATQLGYMVYLKVGATELRADTEVKNPISGKDEKIVGIITDYRWSGGSSDPMEITVLISRANQGLLESVRDKRSAELESKVNFQLYALGPAGDQKQILLKTFEPAVHDAVSSMTWNLPMNRSKSSPIRGRLEAQGGSSGWSLHPFRREISFRLMPSGGKYPQV
ncbi:hypothetical protein EBZ37_14060, partial [bacterium]|nr:hypothetical protein [bacterium]